MFGRRRRQELWCHECEHYVQFVCDLSRDGNHVLNCPNCDHEHCRVVKDGKITDIRWDQRNGPTIRIATSSTAFTVNMTITASTATFVSSMTDYYATTSST
jgi:hypothetical protein